MRYISSWRYSLDNPKPFSSLYEIQYRDPTPDIFPNSPSSPTSIICPATDKVYNAEIIYRARRAGSSTIKLGAEVTSFIKVA